MCTARENPIVTILVCLPDFAWPTASFIERCAEHVEGIHTLSSYGICVDMVRQTLHWLCTHPRVILSRRTTLSSMQSVANKLIKRRCGKVETEIIGGIRTVDVSDCLGVLVRADAVLEHQLQDDAPDAQVPQAEWRCPLLTTPTTRRCTRRSSSNVDCRCISLLGRRCRVCWRGVAVFRLARLWRSSLAPTGASTRREVSVTFSKRTL